MARRLLKGSSMFMRSSMLTSPFGSTVCRRFERTSCVCARVELDERGFTLVELMTVVAIIGVLATLSTYGVRKYMLHAKKAEAVSMLTQIRAAEEAYRDETFQYLGASNFSVWHPTSTPAPGRRDWGATTTMGTNVLLPLGVRPDGPVNYSYAVAAGLAGGTLPTIPTTRTWTFPTPTGPYYIAMAKADLNGDGTYTYALSHSDTSEIYLDDDL